MKKFRIIYVVEAYTREGERVTQRFARNKKIAKKIERQYSGYETYVLPVHPREFIYIDTKDVECR